MHPNKNFKKNFNKITLKAELISGMKNPAFPPANDANIIPNNAYSIFSNVSPVSLQNIAPM
jgi:hypothetical protein